MTFQRKMGILTSKNIDMKIRKNQLKIYIWNFVLYDSEMWIIGKYKEKKLLTFKVWYYRRVLKLSWVYQITN